MVIIGPWQSTILQLQNFNGTLGFQLQIVWFWISTIRLSKNWIFFFHGIKFIKVPYSLGLVEQHQGNLEKLQIHFEAKRDRYKTLRTLVRMLYNGYFSKLKELIVRDQSDDSMMEYDSDEIVDLDSDDEVLKAFFTCENNFKIQGSVIEYLVYFFSFVNFGKHFDTFGQVANVLRQLQ